VAGQPLPLNSSILQDKPTKTADVWCKDGYLEFDDEAAFKKYYESELPLPEHVDKCFTSMMEMYRKVAQEYGHVWARFSAEPEYRQRRYTGYTSAVMLAKDYDPAFAKLLDQSQTVIRLEDDREGGHLIRHRALGDRAAELTNERGIVKVGNIIRQFGHDYYRAILDGDASKLDQLAQFTSTSQADHIFVSQVTNNGVAGQTANRTQFLNSCQNTQGLDRIITQEVLVNNQNEFQRGGIEYKVEVFAQNRPLAIFPWGAKLTCQLSINSGTFRANWQQSFNPTTGWPGSFSNYGTFHFNNIDRVINLSTPILSPSGQLEACTDRYWPDLGCCKSPSTAYFSEMIVVFGRSADVFGTPTITNATFDIYGRNGTNCLMTR
jgi:hypothetical protein